MQTGPRDRPAARHAGANPCNRANSASGAPVAPHGLGPSADALSPAPGGAPVSGRQPIASAAKIPLISAVPIP